MEVDVLLAAATEPERRYPTVQEIADAWNKSPDEKSVDYFYKNREHGIRTFQDDDIIEAGLRPRTKPGT